MNLPSFPASSLLVILGGGLGSWLRFAVARLIGAPMSIAAFPWATLTVNVLGSFAMGLLAGWLAKHGDTNGGENWRLLLGVGVLGGFTTFSAFSLDTALMIERGLWSVAIGYALVSVIGSVIALFGGLYLVRAVA